MCMSRFMQTFPRNQESVKTSIEISLVEAEINIYEAMELVSI